MPTYRLHIHIRLPRTSQDSYSVQFQVQSCLFPNSYSTRNLLFCMPTLSSYYLFIVFVNINQNILNFDVPMDILFRMNNFQSPYHIRHYFSCFMNSVVFFIQLAHLSSQIPTIAQLHQDIHALLIFFPAIKFDNILAIEFLYNFHLLVDNLKIFLQIRFGNFLKCISIIIFIQNSINMPESSFSDHLDYRIIAQFDL